MKRQQKQDHDDKMKMMQQQMQAQTDSNAVTTEWLQQAATTKNTNGDRI